MVTISWKEVVLNAMSYSAYFADFYDSLTMPPIIVKAHKILGRAVDKMYRKEPFATDAESVTLLFEKNQGLI